MKEANALFGTKHYAEADSLYAIVLKEADRLDAVRGRVLCKIRLNNPLAAFEFLDTTKTSASAALHQFRGDITVLSGGNLENARIAWSISMGLELNDRSFLTAFAKCFCFAHVSDNSAVQQYIQLLYGESASNSVPIRIEILQNLKPGKECDFMFELARQYLLYSEVSTMGKLREGLKYLQEIRKLLDKREYTEHVLYLNLFEKLTDKRRERLEAMFGVTQ